MKQGCKEHRVTGDAPFRRKTKKKFFDCSIYCAVVTDGREKFWGRLCSLKSEMRQRCYDVTSSSTNSNFVPANMGFLANVRCNAMALNV